MAEPAGTSSIVLRGLQVHASHGVYEYERQTKQLFLVDIVANLSTLRAAATDDLKETLNYGQLAEETMAIMTGSPVMLIETLAERIADQVLTHPIVESVEVTVHKPNAPIQHPFEDVAVKILRVRGGSKDNVTTSIPRVAITAGTPEEIRAARTTGVISRMAGGGSVSRRANLSQAERVVLSLGGNLGDVPLNLSRAVALLMEIPGFQIDAVSPLVSTRAVLAPGQGSMPNYGNIVVLGRTALEPRELLAHTQNIEDNFGRDRSQVWAARQVDIDLVAVGEQQINTPDLVLPHPRAAVRAFVLYPWYLVEPNAQLQGMPIAQLLEVAPDRDGILEVQENWLREPGGQMAEASGTPGVGASAAVAGAGAVGGAVAGAIGSGAMGAAGMAGGAAFAGQDMVGHYAANPAAFSQGGTGRVSAGQGVAAQGAALNSSGSPTGGTRNVADAVAAIASAANAVISAAGRATGANTANTVSAAGVAGSAVTAAGDAANAVSGRVQIRGVDVELTENDSDFVFRNLLRKEADREAAQRAYASAERLEQQSQEQARVQAQAQQAQQAQVRAQLGQAQQFAAQQLGQQTIAQQGVAQLAAQPQLQQTGTHQAFPQSAQAPAANQAAQQTRAQAQRAAMQSGSGPFAVQQIAQQAQQPQGAAQQQALQMQQPGQPQAAGQPGSRVAQNISAQQATQRVAPQPVQQAAAQQTQVQVQLGQAQQVAAQPALGQQPGQPVQQQTALAANQAAAARQAGQQIGQMVGQAFVQQGAPQGVQQPAQAQGHAQAQQEQVQLQLGQAQQFAAQQGVARSVSPQGIQGQAAPQIQPSSASTLEPRPFATRAAIRQQQQLQQQAAQNASQQAVAQTAQQATGQAMPPAVPPQGVMQANQLVGQTRLVELNPGLTAQGQLAQPTQNGQIGHPAQNAHAAQAGTAASTQSFASAPYVPGVSRTSNAATAGATNAGAVQLSGQAQRTTPNPQAAPSQLQQQGQAPAQSSMHQLGQPQLQAQSQLQGRAQSQGRGQPQQQAGQQSQPQAQPKSHIPTGIPAASITPNREATSAKAPVIDSDDLFPSREALAGDSVPDDRARQWTGNLQQRAKEALSQSRILPEWRVTQESAGARVFDATNGGGVSEELFLPELFVSNSKGDQGNTAIAVATGNTPPSPALGVSVNKNGQVVRSSIHPSSRAATPNGAASNAGGSGYPPPDIPGISGTPAGQGQVQSQGQGQTQVASPAVIPAQLNLIDDVEPVDRPRLSRGVTVRPTPAGQVPVNPNSQF